MLNLLAHSLFTRGLPHLARQLPSTAHEPWNGHASRRAPDRSSIHSTLSPYDAWQRILDIQSFDARAFRACLGPRTVLHAVLGVAREVLAELECEGKELPGIRWKWPNCARQQLGTMLAFKASTLTHKNDVGTRTHRPWRGLVDASRHRQRRSQTVRLGRASGVAFARLFVIPSGHSAILLHTPSPNGVAQDAHNRTCASRTRPPWASCTPPDNALRRDGFMQRLVRCSWIDATGSTRLWQSVTSLHGGLARTRS